MKAISLPDVEPLVKISFLEYKYFKIYTHGVRKHVVGANGKLVNLSISTWNRDPNKLFDYLFTPFFHGN